MTRDNNADRPVRVGIGLVRLDNAFLVRQRPASTALAGFWEFPGGKCEPEEPAEQATRRECMEETGLEVEIGTLRKVVSHGYTHATVELYYYDCVPRDRAAKVDPASGFCWIELTELLSLTFPEANAPILAELAHEVGLSPPEVRGDPD